MFRQRVNKILIVSFLLLTAFIPPKKKVKVYLIGDSTMCYYEPQSGPITGWGMPFANFFDNSVTIDNRARGGRSTRTFISENRWQPVADSLQEGDYVLMQFGHNDEAKETQYAARYTSVPDYKTNLIKFITGTRAKKATPVLITPVTRMRFDKEGKIQQTHVEYTAACYEVAKQYNVPLIDLDKKSRDLLQQFGADNAKLLFMQLAPGEHPNYPEGQKDNTHFNEFGARKIAELVLAGIRELNLELADRVVKPIKK
ncbi:MAG TPA: rhamnogalacturonan acetylesterase [Chitinophagaceae bacterium]|nr:rhamnogalacturonan acetylesterase [Chitinophagaceae bacterium]